MLASQLFAIPEVQQALPAPLQPVPPHWVQSPAQQNAGVVSVLEVAAITPESQSGSASLHVAANSAHDLVTLPVRHSAGKPLPPQRSHDFGQQ